MMLAAESLTRLLAASPSFNETTMNDTTLEEAQRLFKQPAPAPTMTEYQLEQMRIRANYERLKAERLTREAAADGKPS
jgi:hypothetical protein